LAALLQEHGHQPLFLPLQRIEGLPCPAPSHATWLFTSAYAVQHRPLAPWPEEVWAVGEATARALRAAGCAGVKVAGGSLLAFLQTWKGGAFSLLTGENPVYLPDQAEVIHTHRRLRVPYTQEPTVLQQADIILIHNGESLAYLSELTAQRHWPLLVPSQRVGELARTCGWRARAVATVSDAAYVQCLHDFF
jgi:uroporphyrinogen-III synthase